jgi:hypothetical protein
VSSDAGEAATSIRKGGLGGLSSKAMPTLVAVGVGCFLIALMTILLGKNSGPAIFLFDYSDDSVFPYPLTIHNLLYLFFFFGLGDLFGRWQAARREYGFIDQHFLPEDDQTILQSRDLGPIRRRVAGLYDGQNGILPHLIDLSILQFQASRSVDQTVSVLNSRLDLINHQVDLHYSTIRYVVWVIPTVGFVGTVVGIAQALGLIDSPDTMDMGKITHSLGIAFNTTIIALVLSAIIVLLQNVVQKQEESALNISGTYCLKNLINRLYVGDS